ncbi:uncharacterized, partial [Tachysurus ichikawai]
MLMMVFPDASSYFSYLSVEIYGSPALAPAVLDTFSTFLLACMTRLLASTVDLHDLQAG